MGHISQRLHRKLASKASSSPRKTPKRRRGEPLPADVKDIETLIEEGLDPVHAAYVSVQHITSAFAEDVSQLREMAVFSDAYCAAEDEYLPSGPPMSPLTGSFFTSWAFYDLQFSPNETLANCLIESSDVVGVAPHQLVALKNLCASRMGIYEHCGLDGRHVRLRELLTGDQFVCYNTSGYRGHEGELWYVRLLPPLEPELAPYHIAFTTPYVLIQTSKGDWISFLKRNLLNIKSADEREALYRLMKYGPEPNYWNEFVFKAYHHYQHDAIFLAGIPDVQGSLPHA